ncbi:MAG: DUF4395 domain-containing protein [Paludibacter sp.]|nr:DUF4395 domain-containing protein [Paludibacter sp.]
MNNNAFCPISFKKIDENVARLNGFFTVILLTLFLVTSNIFIVLFLLADFLVRGIEKPQWSPLAIVSKFILSNIKAKPHPINAGPKLFAARIGVLFTVLISLSTLAGFNVLALTFTGVFGICALLEAAVGFCVACKLYPFIYKLIYQSDFKKMNFKSDWQI